MTDRENRAEVAITLETTDQQARISYAVEARDAAGQPVRGQDVSLQITGDGSFAPNFGAKELTRTTDESGIATFSWHRSGIYLRRVKATVSATMAAEGSVELKEIEEEVEPGLKISYVSSPIRVTQPRV